MSLHEIDNSSTKRRANKCCARFLSASLLALVAGYAVMGLDTSSASDLGKQSTSERSTPPSRPAADRTGRRRLGKASFYAARFGGRKMADGKRMDLHGENAASLTLPLGTTAKVTNLETGKSSVVIIQDRGPYVDGRIVDLSPATARKIGITPKQGVAKVAVSPIVVPMPDGRVKLGAAASDPELAMNFSDRDAFGWER